jgi:hypothetical protein
MLPGPAQFYGSVRVETFVGGGELEFPALPLPFAIVGVGVGPGGIYHPACRSHVAGPLRCGRDRAGRTIDIGLLPFLSRLYNPTS